jgi:hypothetical protein
MIVLPSVLYEAIRNAGGAIIEVARAVPCHWSRRIFLGGFLLRNFLPSFAIGQAVKQGEKVADFVQ